MRAVIIAVTIVGRIKREINFDMTPPDDRRAIPGRLAIGSTILWFRSFGTLIAQA
jgi:hypothetical protein